MRVDVTSEFYVRVQAEPGAIAAAAQTLGQRTMQPDMLKELVEGKFVDALRTVAAEMTMEEMHEKRGEYVKRVRNAVAADLLQNGLELETVSLTQLDQTAMEFFNPSNAFDAEGLTRLTETIETRKKMRNDIEQDTMIQIRNKNLDTERQALDIDRELEYARLSQERELEVKRAAQRADVAREKASSEQEAERAQITAREAVERARIASERAVEEDRIARERERPGAGNRAGGRRSSSPSSSAPSPWPSSRRLSPRLRLRGRPGARRRAVFTARETEMAEEEERFHGVRRRSSAAPSQPRRRLVDGRRSARCSRGRGLDAIRSLAAKIRHEVEAEGLTPDEQGRQPADAGSAPVGDAAPLIDKLEGIIRESVKPMERIEGIKVLHVEGLAAAAAGGGNGERQRQRQHRRQRRQLGAALPRAGAAGRPAAARDRRAGRRPRQRGANAPAGARKKALIKVYTSR